MLSKTKGAALELIKDPVIRHNFDMLKKELQEMKDYLNTPNYIVSPSTGSAYPAITSQYPAIVQVTPLTARLTTRGNPVMIFLRSQVPDNDFNGGYVSSTTFSYDSSVGILALKRDGRIISVSAFGMQSVPPAGTNTVSFIEMPPSILFCFDDKPPSGTHEWQVWAAADSAGTTPVLTVLNLQLVAIELK